MTEMKKHSRFTPCFCTPEMTGDEYVSGMIDERREIIQE
jgi:hypothetical protein